MKLLPLTILILIASLITSCRQASIVGHWRRADFLSGGRFPEKEKQLGDLILNPDSTFQMMGEGNKNPDRIPGWHTSLSIVGNWSMPDKDELDLQINSPEINFELRFKILKCDKQELQLWGNLAAESNSTQIVSYRRIIK